ncbi:TrkH family potassium uptake protein [archaeon]|nr:MAG: TrkH family potassium uptake protein [archaeon]
MRISLFSPTEDLRIIVRDLGLLVPVVGVMALVSLVVPVVFNEHYALVPLAITAGVSFLVGACLYLPFRGAGEAKLRHGMIVAAFGWLLVATLGSLPFILTALFAQRSGIGSETLFYFKNPLSAFFESVSGYTGTGLTMAAQPNLLPKTLQWWRSFIEWVGGMGVIVLMLTIIAGPRPGAGTHSLYYAEAHREKIHPSIVSTLRTMWWIFSLYTFISVVVLWGAGMPIWEALNHAMTGISTGGFSVTANSIASYNNAAIELVLLPIMFFGAISFAVHYQLMRGKGMILWRDFQTRSFFLFLAGGVVFLVLENMGSLGILRSLRYSGFQFVSAITCTGFQTADMGGWSDTAKVLLAAAMFLGGAAGSTAGGIKIIRALTLIKGAQWRFRKILSPHDAIVPFRAGSTMVDESEIADQLENASLITLLWLVFLSVGVIVILHTSPAHFTVSDALFEVASAQGNVGLSIGITGPEMSTLSKLALCFNMWIGRLEIIPVLLLVRFLLLRGQRTRL